MNPWIFLRFLFLPVLVIAGSLFGTWWNFSIPVICFVIHPLGSLLSGKASSTHPEDEHHFNKTKAYRIIPLLFVPVLIALTVWSVIQSNNNSVIAFAGLAISVGIVNGILGFTLAHELIHRHSRIEKIAGHFLLGQNNYLHYSIEHIGGHHVYACTEKDPHTARLNESFYRFLPRAIGFTFLNAWEIENRRLHRRNISLFSWHNRMLHFLLLHSSLFAFIIVLAGWIPFLFFILQSAVAIFLIHITNYLQHYGLMRNKTIVGSFEKIAAHHAWNSKQGNDGLNLFQISRHADHHIHPSRSYEKLVHYDDAPEQPAGYSGMMWLALAPPLWFRIMNKRISSFTNKTN